MKTLFLVRHAKSDWEDGILSDHDRTLNERGRRDAPAMANHVATNYELPQLVVSSTAIRALTTAEYFLRACHVPLSHVVQTRTLYEANNAKLLRVVTELDNVLYRVMLVGHSPSVTDLVNYLTESNLSHMPTCGVAIVNFPNVLSWQEIGRGTGQLDAFLNPKGILNDEWWSQ